MSLVVWLPLNGSIKNQGLLDAKITGSGVSVNNNGKIGQCYSFSGSNYISINKRAIVPNAPEWTFSCWLYLNDTTTTTATCLFSERTGNNSNGYTIFIYPNTSKILIDDGTRWEVTSITFTATTWYHFVVTRNPNGKFLYINGELKDSTQTVGTTSAVNANGCLIGYAQSSTSLTTGSQGLKGRLNDVRIYNHCLSQKEIEEISKGLVLHYKLDNNNIGNENLLLNSLTPTSGNGATGVVKSIENGIQKIVADNPNNNWVTFANHNTTLALAKGDSFTFSLMIKSPDSDKKPTVYFQSGMGYFSMQGTMSPNWSIIYYTGTWNIDNLATNIHLGFSSAPGTYYIQYFKLEKGTTYTSWAPNHNDQEWSEYGCDNNVIYDSSGYQNNGILNTSITVNSNTARYGRSSYFGNYNEPNIILQNTNILPALNNCTVCWWGKYDTTKTLLLTGQNTSTYLAASDANTFYHAAAGSPVMYKNGVQGTYSCVAGTWDFYVLKNVNLSSWTAMKINSYGSGWPLKGYISDFRIYATALTDDQIKDLYNTSATIDNLGNIYTRELVEI